MEQFAYLKKTRLGRQKTPSRWVKEKPDYLLITRIKMTCGGGMGGSSWYEYVYRVEEIPSNTIMKFKRYDGKEITINTSYIVSAEDFKLAKAELDITEWKSMSTIYDGNNIETYYVLIDDDEELTLVQ